MTPREEKKKIRTDLINNILSMDVDSVIYFEVENFSSFRVQFATEKKNLGINGKFNFSESESEKTKWKVWRKS